MQLYYIRHGQSINNANWESEGYTETPDAWLTDIGKEQAHTLSEYLEKNQATVQHTGWDPHNRHGFGITHIYASLMERAAHTASYTARKLPQLPFAAWTDIHESGGIYGREGDMKHVGLPGKPRSFFEGNFPELALPQELDENGWWNRPVETEEECQLRAERVWLELLSRHRDREGLPEHRVALVSHGTFFMHLMCAILNLPFRTASHGLGFWFLLNNCSISRIALHKDEVTICYLNRTDHLPSHLITG
jgi:2,3-bisphosphoglycerate-dependent phosphoglycerate mutase